MSHGWHHVNQCMARVPTGQARNCVNVAYRPALAERLRDEGRQDLFLRMLTLRFGELPESVLVRVRSATTDKLDRWADKILTAPSLDEVLGG